MRIRLLTFCVAVLSSTAPAQSLPLIPLPREVVRSSAPVALRSAIVLASASNAADRDAARLFVDAMTERKVRARVGEGAGWRVDLLRVGTAAAKRVLDSARTSFADEMKDEGYVLVTNASGARVVAASPAGVFYGLQTLRQLIGISATGPTVRPAVIRDWPAMRWRGVHDDLSRGPVPTLEYQKRQIRTAAAYKVNVWSPYYEHTLEYKSHPLIAIPGGSMSQADVKELLAYANRFHVTIVPEQEAFGHLHHVLKNEVYSPLAETRHGHVLAPVDSGSLPLMRDMLTEVAGLFPGPFLHVGADETFELGKGRSKALVDSLSDSLRRVVTNPREANGIGHVYLGFMKQIEAMLRPITNKKLLFWHDVMGGHSELIPQIPKNMIAVAWNYDARDNMDRFIRPFREAGLETWVAPGVSSWNRVYPNFGTALNNIRGFARDGQAGGSTGFLNTIWDDDGDAIFEQTWYGVLFGAAAAWQKGDSRIEPYQDAYGLQFHGDTTGFVNAAQRSLIAAHAALQSARIGDGGTQLFFMDPWSTEGAQVLIRARPMLRQVRLHAESALVSLAKARRQAHLRELTAIDATELGARRLDWLAAKFQFADGIAQSFVRAAADTARAWENLRDLVGINGTLQDMRDGYALTRELFERAWRNENRPYWMTNALARFDAEIIRWVERTQTMEMLNRRWSRDRVRPKGEDLGIPAILLVPPSGAQ
ncbi:MAG TPA: beta-N-acetylhexosaminidase [Gemmatimonadaceae bacterium]|nr:beta-N-acetylhexosaminidase [Gemmatimonadaceae bacterium]